MVLPSVAAVPPAEAVISHEQRLLSCRDLDAGHGRTVIVAGARWSIARGSWWCLTGENGAGKTTLLHTLLGRLEPLSGVVERDPDIANGEALGVVPQRDDLAETLPLTMLDVVRLGQAGLRLRSGEGAAWAMAALATVELDPRQSFWAASGGQRQRCLLARALAREPKLLVLDEPFNHLDAASRQTVRRVLTELHAKGVAIIAITHDPLLMQGLPVRVARVADGRLTVEAP
jgi:ABC-type Mn2+/Zn2+ transport system ATPase subunit